MLIAGWIIIAFGFIGIVIGVVGAAVCAYSVILDELVQIKEKKKRLKEEEDAEVH